MIVEPTRESTDAYFELSFAPCADLVSTVRRFVTAFYSQIIGNAELTSRLAVATHELLENAVNYATDGHAQIRIALRNEEDAVEVTIGTQNRARPECLAQIRARLEAIEAAEDPSAFYQSLMRETLRRRDGSGLGLGRIRAEADMSLSYGIEGDTVTLRAHTRLDTSRFRTAAPAASEAAAQPGEPRAACGRSST